MYVQNGDLDLNRILARVIASGSCGTSVSQILACCRAMRDTATESQPVIHFRAGVSDADMRRALKKFPNASTIVNASGASTVLPDIVTRKCLRKLHFCRAWDVSALAGCSSLHTLNLSSCRGVTDVSALAGCSSLHTLDLSSCRGVTDVSALVGVEVRW